MKTTIITTNFILNNKNKFAKTITYRNFIKPYLSKYIKDCYCVLFTKNNNKIYIHGVVVLEHINSKKYMTHSFVSDKYRNKGFGSKIYIKAIDFVKSKKCSITSSYNPSEDARNVWEGKSISKKYRIIRNKSWQYVPIKK